MTDHIRAEVVTTPEACRPFLDEWDALAVASEMPYAAPAWMLAWWDHVRPPRSILLVIPVTQGADLIGVLPLYGVPRALGSLDVRFLGTGHRVAPLARPGAEADVARAGVSALVDHAPPTVLRLDRFDGGSSWPALLQTAWPGRVPARAVEFTEQAPVVPMSSEGFEEWLAGKSGNFRQQMRAARRRVIRDGGEFRVVTSPDDLPSAVDDFVALHRMRWGAGSGLPAYGLAAMLRDAGSALLARERFRLCSIHLDGEAIASAVNVAAGGRTAYWNIGWNPAFSRHKPGMLAVLWSLEDAFSRGGSQFDLGGGANAYKDRFTDVDAPLAWSVLIPRGARHGVGRAMVLQGGCRRTLRRGVGRLPAPVRGALTHAPRAARGE